MLGSAFLVYACGSRRPQGGERVPGVGERGVLWEQLGPECHPPGGCSPRTRDIRMAPKAALSCCPVPGAGDPAVPISPGTAPHRLCRWLQGLSTTQSPLVPVLRATCPAPSPARRLLPLIPSFTSPARGGDGCSRDAVIPAAGARTPRTQGDQGPWTAQLSPRPTHSLRTPWPGWGRAKAFWQRMSGFCPRGRVMFLLLQICRWVLEGRRSEIITAPIAGSGSGSTRSRQIGGFA